jgi:hypothetical protein
MNKYKYPILAIVIAIALGVGYGLKEYNRGHDSTEDLSTDIERSASELLADYQNDEAAANATYLDKVIAVHGAVASVNESEQGSLCVNLQTDDPMFVVSCEVQEDQREKALKLTEGQEVALKGKCSGATFDVVLNRCVIINE